MGIIANALVIVLGGLLGSKLKKGVSQGSFQGLGICIVIALAARAMEGFFTDVVVSQLCCVGFIILFFTGFNLFVDSKHKVSNLNMLPGVLMILLFHGVKGLFV